MTAKHSPLPWKAEWDGEDWHIIAADGQDVVVLLETDATFAVGGRVADAANINFIVRACNGYAKLREALEACVRQLQDASDVMNNEHDGDGVNWTIYAQEARDVLAEGE